MFDFPNNLQVNNVTSNSFNPSVPTTVINNYQSNKVFAYS